MTCCRSVAKIVTVNQSFAVFLDSIKNTDRRATYRLPNTVRHSVLGRRGAKLLSQLVRAAIKYPSAFAINGHSAVTSSSPERNGFRIDLEATVGCGRGTATASLVPAVTKTYRKLGRALINFRIAAQSS